jgi:signal transduction histidine kinase
MAEMILYADSRFDISRARIRALRKTGYWVIETGAEFDVQRLAIDPKPHLMVISRTPGLSPESWSRLKADPATAGIPVIAICSPGTQRQWARSADLCLPDTVTSGQLVAVIRLILRVRDAEQELARIESDCDSCALTEKGLTIRRCSQNRENLSPNRKRLARRPHSVQSDLVNVAHDLRSPLCTVAMVSSWIRGEYSDRMDATGREYLALLQKSIERMTVLVDSALEAPSTPGRE